MKLRFFDFIIFLLFFLLLVSAFFMLNYFKSEGGKCTDNPLGYARDKIGNSSACYCVNFDKGFYETYSTEEVNKGR